MKKTLAIILFLFSTPALAGVQTGTVSWLTVRHVDGLIYFVLDGDTKTGTEPCPGSTWVIADENSETGKKQYAMLLAAHVSGKQIRVHGANNCNRSQSGESVDWIQFFQ